MDIINRNLKYLRSLKGMTQDSFAKELGIKRASLGSYEEGRAKPKYDILIVVSDLFSVSVGRLLKEELLGKSLEEIASPVNLAQDMEGKSLRVLSITVDGDDKENIELVPVKAAASYLSGYADTEFIADLPRFSLPFLPRGTYRAFEIKGDSMLPLSPGSIVIGEYVENWREVKAGDTYVIISEQDGVVYKRAKNSLEDAHSLVCQSDNTLYPEFEIPVGDLKEIWKATAVVSKDIPIPLETVPAGMDKVMELMREQQKEIIDLRWELKKKGSGAVN
ncbi:helix-turn-helix domain-containing protein [Chitinophagales bacterium]|nr:helix-turn-helix domain-containing protein [Chitinophagales bacterium]